MYGGLGIDVKGWSGSFMQIDSLLKLIPCHVPRVESRVNWIASVICKDGFKGEEGENEI